MHYTGHSSHISANKCGQTIYIILTLTNDSHSDLIIASVSYVVTLIRANVSAVRYCG
jgi:hypothetical protein